MAQRQVLNRPSDREGLALYPEGAPYHASLSLAAPEKLRPGQETKKTRTA